ncbi:MAG TPA: Nudix family hydrolase [Marinobacter sp.]|nr:Nudix family hydrolase [Marinobacter sp.]
MPSTGPEVTVSVVKKQIHVAVGVVWRDGRVLIARRPEHAHQGGLLEFPGGKVEPGESVQQALVRELAEETGLEIPPGSLEPVIGIRHDYGDKQVFLDVWQTGRATGSAEGREGQPVFWLAPGELQDDDFPAANRSIIRALKLPSVLHITGVVNDVSEISRRVGALAGSGGSELILLRAPQLPQGGYQALAAQTLTQVQGPGTGVLLHGAPALIRQFPGAAGLHLPWREAQALSERPVGHDVLLGVSCHSSGQLRHAEALGADYAVLGPVLPTRSHPGEPAMGWAGFSALVAEAALPVYGLGGLHPGLVASARHHGGQGIAGIGFWWH